MKIARNYPLRMLCALMAVILVLCSTPISATSESFETITLDEPVPVYAAANPQPVNELNVGRFNLAKELKATPYVSEVLADELRAICTYAVGKDPNEGKSANQKGQNTRNNVALTLIDLLRDSKTVRSLKFVLEPYENQKNVYEICAYYTTIFSNKEQVFHSGVLHDYNTQMVYRADGTGILGIGYDFNFDFNTFISSDDPWQRDFGFCRLYDQAAILIGDLYNTARIKFVYDGKEWMVQLWKGIYSFNMVGGEIGVYNKPLDRKADYYDCATDAQRIKMTFNVSCGDEVIVTTPYNYKWWQTTFTYHKAVAPSKLTLTGTLKFPNRTMMNAFVESLKNYNSSIAYSVQGTTVSITWPATR